MLLKNYIKKNILRKRLQFLDFSKSFCTHFDVHQGLSCESVRALIYYKDGNQAG